LTLGEDHADLSSENLEAYISCLPVIIISQKMLSNNQECLNYKFCALFCLRALTSFAKALDISDFGPLCWYRGDDVPVLGQWSVVEWADS